MQIGDRQAGLDDEFGEAGSAQIQKCLQEVDARVAARPFGPSFPGGRAYVWVRPEDGDWALRQIPLTTANLAAQVVAVPEPGTVALALIGIGSLFGFMRRRR